MFAPIVAHLTVGGARLLTGVQAHWAGCSPADVPRIYFANHSSHMDFVLLSSALPARIREKTRPVAASDYWDHGAVRQYIIRQVFQGVLVDRRHSSRTMNPIEPMIEALDRGESLILFPEGTRGNGEWLQPFKCGIYHLAKARPRVELIPVWMENTCRVMPKGALLPIPLLCSVKFGPPTWLRPDETKESFLARMRQAVIDLSIQ
jgi:1-acyl-sn-glycerol-3-phosphate acyltransferase